MRVYADFAFQGIELVFFDQFEFGEDALPRLRYNLYAIYCVDDRPL